MRIQERNRTNHDAGPTYASGCLDRVRVQYESLSRVISDAIVERRLHDNFVEVPCKLAPAIRRRRLVS